MEKYITTGSGKSAVLFRVEEARLLSEGKYLEAFDLNAKAIRDAYGTMYNRGLQEAREQFINEVIPNLKEQAANQIK